MLFTTAVFLNVVLLILAGIPTAAQEPRLIPDEISCPTCVVSVEKLFELGGPGDTANIVHTNHLPMDSRGRIYFQSVYVPGTIQVFDGQGRHLSSFGREGEGPGEFRSWAALLVSPGDSLFVFDSGNRRLSVFSPDHELVRESRIGLIPSDGFFRADGSIFVSAVDRSPQRFGIPLHVLSAEGEILQSFGEVSRPLVGRDRLMLGRRVSSSSPTVTWVSHIYQYILERRDQEGEFIELLERRPEWFPWTEVPPFLPQSERDPPPFPLVTDIQVDDSGLLWVLLWVASDDWKSAFGEGGQSPARADLHDTIIEVIDPSERTVIGRTRLDEIAIGFSAPGVFYTYNDRDVFDRISLWRVILSNDPA